MSTIVEIIVQQPAQRVVEVVVNGSKGSDGKSAYQIWLDAGNVGTQQDFLDSLIGADGAQGQDGQPGAQGPQGPAGPVNLSNQENAETIINSIETLDNVYALTVKSLRWAWDKILTVSWIFLEKIKFTKGINLTQNPNPTENGDLWYNPTTHNFQGRANSTNLDFITGIISSFIVATPATVNGAVGDKAGQIAYDNNHFWFCYQDFVNISTPCWLKVPRSPENPLDLVVATPATLTSAGFAGQYAEDSRWMYFCVATNTWRRIDKRGQNIENLVANKNIVALDSYYQFLNTNGANRDVTLYASPTAGDCFFFKNTGSEVLTIKNSLGNTIATLSNVNGITSVLVIWDGATWQNNL